MSNVKLSNVIGAPFSADVLKQLQVRSERSSTTSRSGQEVLFLANKMAWARLVSSINIVIPPLENRSTGTRIEGIGDTLFYQSLGLNPTDYPKPDSLAKSWILEAGTSTQNGNGINLRQGIGPNGAYGLGGTQELGYRPMPGLTSVQVETTGRLGSLRQATINFKVWNINQLSTIEALYFRLGYSMLLEWGHVQYYSNDGEFKQKDIYGINDPFVGNKRKEEIQQLILKKSRETNGNYDGMLGVVSNFNWAFNQEGGYDCTVRLIGLGSIMDSLRINQSYTLPEGLIKKLKKDEDAIQAQLDKENKPQGEEPPKTEKPSFVLPPKPSTPQELYNIVKEYNGHPDSYTYDQFLADPQYSVLGLKSLTQGVAPEYFKAFFVEIETKNTKTKKLLPELNAAQEEFGGLWLKRGTSFYNVKASATTQVGLNVKSSKTGVAASMGDFIDRWFAENPDRARAAYEEGPVSYESLALYFQYQTKNYVLSGTSGQVVDVPLDSIMVSTELSRLGGTDKVENRGEAGLGYIINSSNGTSRRIYFNLTATLDGQPDRNAPVTRRTVIKGLEAWINQGAYVETVVTKVEEPGSDNLSKISGEFNVYVDAPSLDGTKTVKRKVIFRFETNNPGFISTSNLVVTQPPPATNTTEKPNTGDTSGEVNQADTATVKAPAGYQSALHAMLTIVKAELQADSKTVNQLVAAADITATTQQFYNSGILKDVFKSENGAIKANEPPIAGPDGLPFDLTAYALKGFNSSLMTDPRLYNETPKVDFKKLCTAYIIRYDKVGEDGSPNNVQVPVYIPFGYLLAFLNNMCLIYDSTTKQASKQPSTTEKRPYVYIDFNPNTNFCLTSPQQFSIDPYVCMVPLQASQEQYQSIFPDNVKEVDTKTKLGTLKDGTPFFNPSTENTVSKILAQNSPFQSPTAAYQGNIMNILLNIDYLLDIVATYQGSDPQHAVHLQPFLERILTDVNKCLGNMNLFKVSYRDEANTVQIQDSQWAPNLDGESTVMNANPEALFGTLPVFTNKSTLREFQFKTVMSTKLASMLAVSAQAATGSVNAKDHSSLSWLNKNFQDRYKPYVQDPDNGAAGSSKDGKKDAPSNEVEVASLFNSHIRNLYLTANAVSKETVQTAKNYYIERVSKVKSSDPVTVAAPFIPADVDLTIDGISGIIMGNAFLIPEERMPVSLRGSGGIPKIGFIVTGLTHTIEGNQWLTNIRGQMIKLRNAQGLGAAAIGGGSTTTSTGGTGEGAYPGACKEYSGARQVLAPASVNSSNFSTTYYPGFRFTKGTTDIDLAKFKLSPLTEAQIVDDTTKNRFNIGKIEGPVPYFVIHHTGGRGTADDVYRTFYCRGLPAQYVIDRNGVIHRFMPDGALAWHAGNFNSKSIGVEIIASNDKDILAVQRDAAIRLAHYLGFKVAQLVGHGKISSNKQPDEGYTVVRSLNPNYTANYDSNFG